MEIHMIRSKKDLRYYLSQDEKTNNRRESLFKRIVNPDPINKFLRLLRYVEYYGNVPSVLNNLMYTCYKWRLGRQSLKLGFHIPPNVFGAGLSIPHYGTIVVNRATRVGENCRLHVGVNIGTSAGQKGAPRIGDNVYIGPGAIIFGDISIASNVTIGANATVNKSFITQHCTIAGTPAQVVKTNSANWLEFNHVEL